MRIMELTLNLVWALIAAASYAILLRHLAGRGTGRSGGPTQPQCVIALTCVLAILFPVISLTDDLHEMQATAEEASSSGLVIKQSVASHSPAPGRSVHQALFILAPLVANSHWSVLGVLTGLQERRSESGSYLLEVGRAPPFFASVLIR
jgi:hypothetical protein